MREKNPFAGLWAFPGGKLEFGETIDAGICREINEELELNVRVISK